MGTGQRELLKRAVLEGRVLPWFGDISAGGTDGLRRTPFGRNILETQASERAVDQATVGWGGKRRQDR